MPFFSKMIKRIHSSHIINKYFFFCIFIFGIQTYSNCQNKNTLPFYTKNRVCLFRIGPAYNQTIVNITNFQFAFSNPNSGISTIQKFNLSHQLSNYGFNVGLFEIITPKGLVIDPLYYVMNFNNSGRNMFFDYEPVVEEIFVVKKTTVGSPVVQSLTEHDFAVPRTIRFNEHHFVISVGNHMYRLLLGLITLLQ